MIIAASRDQAAATRTDYTSPAGARATVDTYIGVNRALAGAGHPVAQAAGTYPMAYLVAQAPGSTLQAHFHQADQFQVFVGGSGRIGTHPVRPLTVHFAGAHSPYGPLVAGRDGLQYLTLRRSWDPGAQYMPGSAHKLRDLPGRRHRIHTSQAIDLQRLAPQAAGTCHVDCLFSEQDMGAWLAALGSRASWSASAGSDRFVHVLSGQVQAGSFTLAAGACLFACAAEGELRIAAASPARILLTRFDPMP